MIKYSVFQAYNAGDWPDDETSEEAFPFDPPYRIDAAEGCRSVRRSSPNEIAEERNAAALSDEAK